MIRILLIQIQNGTCMNPSEFELQNNSWLKKIYWRFITIRGHPREIAFGFALGLFVGMSPTMGVQTVIAISIAAIFGWNKLSTAMGVWITNPFTALFIYTANYFIGASILTLTSSRNFSSYRIKLSGMREMLTQTPEIFWTIAFGGVVLGIPIAIVGYHLSYSAVINYRRKIRKKLTLKMKKIKRSKKRKTKDRRKK
ncbi:MAG: hypothetical protein B6244_08390 [Candidatus Cloacimonetes bacterium 4572_55]|nr:MAG: hypothetical protein B6244_08390 [Candidatus Cloacimonetes bacterium 4572_55]